MLGALRLLWPFSLEKRHGCQLVSSWMKTHGNNQQWNQKSLKCLKFLMYEFCIGFLACAKFSVSIQQLWEKTCNMGINMVTLSHWFGLQEAAAGYSRIKIDPKSRLLQRARGPYCVVAASLLRAHGGLMNRKPTSQECFDKNVIVLLQDIHLTCYFCIVHDFGINSS